MGAGERETQEGCNTSTHTADSLCCTAETNTALKSNYSRYIYIYTYKASRGSDLELAQSHSWQILLVEASHRSSSYSNGGEIDSTLDGKISQATLLWGVYTGKDGDWGQSHNLPYCPR